MVEDCIEPKLPDADEEKLTLTADRRVNLISGARRVARYRELLTQPDVVELAGVDQYPQLQVSAAVVAAVVTASCGIN